MTHRTKGKAPYNFLRKIKITRETINKSVQMHALLCMVATAIRDTIPGVSSINVTVARIKFNWNGWRLDFDVPPHVQTQLVNFDTDKSLVTPFEFTLQRPGVRPVEYHPHAVPRGKTKRRNLNWKAPESRVCVRRYHKTGNAEVRPYKKAA